MVRNLEGDIDQPGGWINLSVVIIAYNEQKTLNRCLSSLPAGAEVILVDSGSEDNTVEIAKKFGARVEYRKFDNYGAQKNFALTLAGRSWILSLDADECLDQALRSSIVEIVGQTGRENAFRVKRQLEFLGKKMRFGKSMDRPIRLFRKDKANFVGEVHEVLKCSDQVQTLNNGTIIHRSYDDITDYFKRFNFYTSEIANGHFQRKNRFRRVYVLRPFSEFVMRYFLRLGFLDGYPGFCYALFSSLYAFVKYAKLKEHYDKL